MLHQESCNLVGPGPLAISLIHGGVQTGKEHIPVEGQSSGRSSGKSQKLRFCRSPELVFFFFNYYYY